MSSLQPVNDFETIAMPHMNDLYRAARRTLGSQTEAEDVVQETYLQAWKSFHRFEPGTNIRAWMFRIMFHVIQHHRRKAFRLVLLKDEEEHVDFLEAQMHLIRELGYERYLSMQMGEDEEE